MGACGAASPAAPQAATQPAGTLADVRRLAAALDGHVAVATAGGECLDRCRATASICDSARRICAIAADLAEMEALESCRRAEAACVEARRLVADPCGCP
jgi:hypothetical protein